MNSLTNQSNIMNNNRRQILDLNEKISNLNLDINNEKSNQKVNYEQKLKQIDQKVKVQSQNDEREFKYIYQNIMNIDDQIGNQRVAFQL